MFGISFKINISTIIIHLKKCLFHSSFQCYGPSSAAKRENLNTHFVALDWDFFTSSFSFSFLDFLVSRGVMSSKGECNTWEVLGTNPSKLTGKKKQTERKLGTFVSVKYLGCSYLVRLQRPLVCIAFDFRQPEQVVDRVSGDLQTDGKQGPRRYLHLESTRGKCKASNVTLPNIVCLLLSSSARASVKKNWLPLSCCPAFAMATNPRRMKRSREWNSS